MVCFPFCVFMRTCRTPVVLACRRLQGANFLFMLLLFLVPPHFFSGTVSLSFIFFQDVTRVCIPERYSLAGAFPVGVPTVFWSSLFPRCTVSRASKSTGTYPFRFSPPVLDFHVPRLSRIRRSQITFEAIRDSRALSPLFFFRATAGWVP